MLIPMHYLRNKLEGLFVWISANFVRSIEIRFWFDHGTYFGKVMGF